jgi:FkbM family methyltransferase
MLNQNIKLNQLTNVTALNYIVYSKEMQLDFFQYARMLEWDEKTERKSVTVNANTLDNLLRSYGIREVNWIKIDVEEAELEVLKMSS